MAPRTRQHLGWSVGFLTIALIALTAGISLASRSLTSRERELVGNWTFLEPDKPDQLLVYRLGGNGRIQVEYYNLKSDTPHEPSIRTEGVWHLEPDGTLVVEAASGPVGWWVELSRRAREMRGEPGNSHKMLRRFYRDVHVDDAGLHAQVSRRNASGKSVLIDLLMERETPTTR